MHLTAVAFCHTICVNLGLLDRTINFTDLHTSNGAIVGKVERKTSKAI